MRSTANADTLNQTATSAVNAKGPYRVTTPDARLEAERNLSKRDWKVLGFIMALASLVRLWGLQWPDSVVFDEVHFGGFAKKYIIGRFFFDVHPPLAKMLFAVFAFLGGFDGNSDFEFSNIGDDYIGPHTPYLTMRLLPSLTGLATIALCYATLRSSGCRTYVAAITSLILTFENTFATESRYILLDSPLVFFVALTAYAFKRFENTVPFSLNWIRYLFLTGLSLGVTVSAKWVGLFTVGWVGSLTVYQLWWIWGDLSVTKPKFARHFLARAAFLIALPAAIYAGMFALHFFCADNMGDGADLLPRWFQASLKHNKLPTDVPADVAFGSSVSLRHVDTNGGWLHSHVQVYPTGSEQQQITLYSHVDDNNLWRIENGTETWNPNQETGPVFLKDGDIIRLMHIDTERRLHSHDHKAPVSSTQDYIFEVSGYGFTGFEGDSNDNWRVKIVKQMSIGDDAKDHVQALRTYFQLEHTMMGCLLYSKSVKLPDWGFEQQEVSCIRNGNLHNTVWMIESNEHSDLPESTPRLNYIVPGFWKKFFALNKAMWDVNKDLTEPHNWESRPLSWVLLKRGINMWGENNRQVYLVGNLPVYWLIAAGIVVLAGYKAMRLLWWQHVGSIEFAPRNNSPWALFDHHFGNYALGWWFHLFPSFLMVRQLFLHHYLGSLYFGILMIGQLFELAMSVLNPKYGKLIPAAFFGVVVGWYWWYSPLIYGSPWTRSLCEQSKFMDMDFACELFYEDKSSYKQQAIELKESRYSAWHGLAKPTPTSVEDVEQEPQVVQGGEQQIQPVEQAQQTPEAEEPDHVKEFAQTPEAEQPPAAEEQQFASPPLAGQDDRTPQDAAASAEPEGFVVEHIDVEHVEPSEHEEERVVEIPPAENKRAVKVITSKIE